MERRGWRGVESCKRIRGGTVEEGVSTLGVGIVLRLGIGK